MSNAAKWQEQMDNAAGRDAFKVPPAVEFVQWVGESGWTIVDGFWWKGRQSKNTWPLFMMWEMETGRKITSDEESLEAANFGRYILNNDAHYDYDEESDSMKWRVFDDYDGERISYNYFTTSEMYSFFKQNKRPQ